MGRSSIFLLLILNYVVQFYCQENGNTTMYSPEELLSKIFNLNATLTPRQNKYVFIKFEDTFGPQSDNGKPNQPFTFEEQPNTAPSGSNAPFKFDDDQIIHNADDVNDIQHTNNQGIIFQDDNKIEDPKPPKKKRRRRRRKPKYQNGGNIGYPYQVYPGQSPNVPQGYPGPYPGNSPQGYPTQDPNIPQYPGYPGNPQGHPGPHPQGGQGQPGQYPYPYPGGSAGQFYRPPRRRPKQSFASEALTAVTEALTSIALYDDYQCVPRLLCEAAGGGALGSSSVLQNIAGLQPLLTLLAAYNGISSSPLFIFGRAVFLGMTAKGNLGTCRYAYPQCPNDPEQLVHYLNNHNGGFFRFFNAPQVNPQGQQNVEQFYNQLSQNYGYYQPGPDQLTNQQNYGIYQPNVPNLQNNGNYQPNIPDQQNYGLYQSNNPPQLNNPNFQVNPQGYPGYPYGNGPQNYGIQNYGPTYPYQNNYGYYKINGKEKNKIEKRIQNRPIDQVNNDDISSNDDTPKWLFPESDDDSNNYNNYRGGRDLKFPDEEVNQHIASATFPDNNRKGKGFSFPNYHNNIKYVNYYKEPPITTTPSYSNNNYGFYQNKYNFESTTQKILYQNYNSNVNYNNGYNNNNYNQNKYNQNSYNQNGYNQNSYNQNNYNQNDNNEEFETVYVIRGNGDPNHPEIVKLKPGEKLL